MDKMQEVQLEKPQLKHKEAYLDYCSEWGEEKMIPYASRMFDKTYEEWIEEKEQDEHVETAPKSYVPSSTYLLVKDGRILGCVNIRHQLNDRLFALGGHIGGGIRPSERNKGYSNRMLKMALGLAKEMGIESVLMTCNDFNLGSKRSIESCGGILENQIFDIDHYVLRYWITLKS